MGKKRKASSIEDNPTLDDKEVDEEGESVASIADPSEMAEKVVMPSDRKKKPIPGVLYLSRIPNKMNVTIIRSYFDQYGRTGRIYLQLTSKCCTVLFAWLDRSISFRQRPKAKINESAARSTAKVGLSSNRSAKQNSSLNSSTINKSADDDVRPGTRRSGISSECIACSFVVRQCFFRAQVSVEISLGSSSRTISIRERSAKETSTTGSSASQTRSESVH